MSSLVLNKSSSNFLIISVNTCNITVPKLDAKCIHSSKQLSYAWKVGDFKLDDKLLQYLQRSLLLFRTWIINMYAILWTVIIFMERYICQAFVISLFVLWLSSMSLFQNWNTWRLFFKQSAISFHHSYKKSYATNND